MTNHYDTIIGTALPSPLAPSRSTPAGLPRGEGDALHKNKALVFTEAYQATTSKFSISLKCESLETSVNLC